jgi:membrane-associated phospholipid phosphatase
MNRLTRTMHLVLTALTRQERRLTSKRWAMKRDCVRVAVGTVLVLTALSSSAPTFGQQVDEGAKVGTWKTWNLASADEITVPAPPADTSDQTKAEITELRLLQTVRGPAFNRAVESWAGLGATKAWTDLALRVPTNAMRLTRISAYLHTAMLDAAIVAYRAKYAYNRKPPSQLAADIVALANAAGGEPSYPSEAVAMAGAAAAVLAFLHPAEAKTYEALAQEAAASRLIAGTNYRSDVEAGLALGRAVAARAIARAQTDGSDAQYTGTFPTGPGLWTGKSTVEPLKGTWRPWLMTSGSQFRPGPPPAFGSAEFNEALAEVKRLATSVTASERALSTFWLASGPWVPFYDTAYALMAQEKTSPARAARILAHVATSTDDAAIACWDAKFHYWFLRPIEADPTIPLLTPTPPYPDYTSGFSSQVGALSEAIGYFFPREAERLKLIAEQCAIMRVYQGIHYRFACEAGLLQGRQAARLGAERDKANDL